MHIYLIKSIIKSTTKQKTQLMFRSKNRCRICCSENQLTQEFCVDWFKIETRKKLLIRCEICLTIFRRQLIYQGLFSLHDKIHVHVYQLTSTWHFIVCFISLSVYTIVHLLLFLMINYSKNKNLFVLMQLHSYGCNDLFTLYFFYTRSSIHMYMY